MPASKAFSGICPSIDYGKFHAFCGGGKVISAYGYHHQQVRATPTMIDSVYACSMCGACDTACKTHFGDNVEPFDTIFDLRERLAEDGKTPPAIKALIENLQREGAPQGKRSERNEWAEGLGITDARKQQVEVLLHVGSENAFDHGQWPNLRFLVQLLETGSVNFGIVYEDENDSGGFAYETGYRKLAAQLATRWRELVKASGAKTLLVAGAHDYASFKNLYPRLGLALDSVRVLHTSEFLEDLLADKLSKLSFKKQAKVTYHDSCRLGRRSETYHPWQGEKIRVLNTMAVSDSPRTMNYGNQGNYDSPRRLLLRIEGLELVEMERNRQFAYCCGGETSVTEAYPDMADMAAVNCLKEAQASGADVLVTASACCRRNMSSAAKRNGIDIAVTDLMELMSEAIKESE